MSRVDLTNCDREPIHVIGHVQPHGVLVALDPRTLAVVQASESARAHLRIEAADMLGRSFLDFLPSRLHDALEAVEDDDPTHFATAPVNGVGSFHLVAHRNDDRLIVEIEPSVPSDATDLRTLPRRLLRALQSAESSQAFYDVLVRETRALTGFDRTMLYRFGEDGTGLVVAESAEPHLPPFLGLTYPASDIPQQARRLFALNTVRLYPDVDYEPSPLASLDDRPLDMTYCVLRGVSSMHTQYLQNMGVKASMAFAITQGEGLWGLVALHHYEPRTLDYPLRASCELLAGMASMQVVQKEEAEGLAEREARRAVLDRLVGRVQLTPQLPATVAEGEETILDLVAADGAAFVVGDEVRLLGDTPTEDEVRSLARRLDGEQTESVLALEREATAHPEAVGLLSAQVSPAATAYVLWFRKEVARTVTWAGDPSKPFVDEETLFPRASFVAWTETVRGRSLPWTVAERDAAERLRIALVEALVHRTGEILRLNAELERRNEDLDAFASVAAHDLREPLRGIRNYAQFLQEDYADRLDDEGTEQLATIGRLAGRLEGLLDSLLRFARVARDELGARRCDVAQAVDEACALLSTTILEKKAEVAVQAPLPTVDADLDLVVEIFVNLIANALKYNDSGVPRIEIAAEGRTITVKDNGIGIPERHQDAVFTLFKRLHGRDAFGGGTGMGLTIVKKAMERLGGRVGLQSTPGVGTTFRLEFPA